MGLNHGSHVLQIHRLDRTATAPELKKYCSIIKFYLSWSFIYKKYVAHFQIMEFVRFCYVLKFVDFIVVTHDIKNSY